VVSPPFPVLFRKSSGAMLPNCWRNHSESAANSLKVCTHGRDNTGFFFQAPCRHTNPIASHHRKIWTHCSDMTGGEGGEGKGRVLFGTPKALMNISVLIIPVKMQSVHRERRRDGWRAAASNCLV